MKQKNKSGIVLVYALFLLAIGSIMGIVVFKNSFVYYNNIEYQNILENLHTNIYTKKNTAFKLVRIFNSNGSGFVDNISCPQDVTMSGNTLKTTAIQTTLNYVDGSTYCRGLYQGFNFDIYLNANRDNFNIANYRGNYVTLTGTMYGMTTFTGSDTDATLITFFNDGTTLGGIDKIDDNFNSDDYKVVSTGSSSTGTLYPNNFIDDDVIPREVIFGYIGAKSKFKNIFWSNDKINKFIANNPNNNDILHKKLGNVTAGYVILTIDGNYDIKLVKYDKKDFNLLNTLKSVEVLNGINLTGNGYIQNNGTTLSISTIKTGNEYVFDFSLNDYAIFIKNIGNNNLSYNISSETIGGTGVYISPIDDSSNILKFLGTDIYIDSDGKYSSASFMITGNK